MHECAINRNENCLEDLISKKSLIATIEKEAGMNIPEWLRDTIMNAPPEKPEITLESAIDYLDSIGWMQEHDRILTESAQAERPKGKWIPHKSIFGGLGERVYTCNRCGYNIGFHTENFCPECGSRMRGK